MQATADATVLHYWEMKHISENPLPSAQTLTYNLLLHYYPLKSTTVVNYVEVNRNSFAVDLVNLKSQVRQPGIPFQECIGAIIRNGWHVILKVTYLVRLVACVYCLFSDNVKQINLKLFWEVENNNSASPLCIGSLCLVPYVLVPYVFLLSICLL